jgi:hypothetical protein
MVCDTQFGQLMAADGATLAAVDSQVQYGKGRTWMNSWLRIGRVEHGAFSETMRAAYEHSDGAIRRIAAAGDIVVILYANTLLVWQRAQGPDGDVWHESQTLRLRDRCGADAPIEPTLSLSTSTLVAGTTRWCVYRRTRSGFVFDAEIGRSVDSVLGVAGDRLVVDDPSSISIYERTSAQWQRTKAIARPEGMAYALRPISASGRWWVATAWDERRQGSVLLVYASATDELLATLHSDGPVGSGGTTVAVSDHDLLAITRGGWEGEGVERWHYDGTEWRARDALPARQPFAVAIGDLAWIGNPTSGTQEPCGGTIEGHVVDGGDLRRAGSTSEWRCGSIEDAQRLNATE